MKVEVDSGGPNKLILAIVAILFAMLVTAIFAAFSYRERYHIQKEHSADLSASLSSIHDSAKFFQVKWENGTKTSAASINALKMDFKNLQSLYRGEIDKARRLGANPRDINAVTQVHTETAASKIVPVYIDTLRQLTACYSDSFTLIKCAIRRDGIARIDYSIRDSLYILDMYKRHRILFGLIKWKERQNKMIVTSMNPNTVIRGFLVHKVIED